MGSLHILPKAQPVLLGRGEVRINYFKIHQFQLLLPLNYNNIPVAFVLNEYRFCLKFINYDAWNSSMKCLLSLMLQLGL